MTTPLFDISLSQLHWDEGAVPRSALWRSERGAPAPQRVVLVDDTTSADTAYRLACEGVGLLWRGDFQNAKHLLQALERRLDNVNTKPAKRSKPQAAKPMVDIFHAYRQTQSQRARVLGMVLIPMHADYSIPLRRAPDVQLACAQAWGSAQAASASAALGSEAGSETGSGANLQSVVSLRELQGIISAFEWRKNGVEIAALGDATEDSSNRIHAHYGVFSPVRAEYLGLLVKAPLPVMLGKPPQLVAFDIGTGTGVLAAVLARRSIGRIIATDVDARALACATDNLARLRVNDQVQVLQADLFPDVATHGKAHLIVCNPPWLPGRPSTPLERAIYDEGSHMLLGFLNGLPAHLANKGEGWLILSDLAEHLGLRTREQLLGYIEAAGLKVIAKLDTRPHHPKAMDTTDPLYAARGREITSLWRLAVK